MISPVFIEVGQCHSIFLVVNSPLILFFLITQLNYISVAHKAAYSVRNSFLRTSLET